jgi:hypothetical protein
VVLAAKLGGEWYGSRSGECLTQPSEHRRQFVRLVTNRAFQAVGRGLFAALIKNPTSAPSPIPTQ